MPTTSSLARVYNALFLLDVGGVAGNDLVLYVHPNGLAVVCLAPSHTLLADTRPLSVSFGHDASQLVCPTNGKKRHGNGVVLGRDAPLALVTCGSDTVTTRACVRCKLLEANARLEAEPGLLREEPDGAGFLAIVQPFPDALLDLQKSALSRSAFAAARPMLAGTAAG